MPRIFLIAAFAFFIPFIFYDLTKRFMGRGNATSKEKTQNETTETETAPVWADAPLPLLGLIGAALAILTIFSLVFWSEGRL